ncbi:glycosyltransferase family protein [Thermococcus gorgonarius]|uniref:Glycosyltransferase RgtA/B/C/D-like domain-containing protein n=1 Tax=Thermococcus gorgonarius TaxID=71997 RepID=A0A2Z2MEW0_THEGO|nr:glycosyltransferase 87 family protein [Thermococcus gorgonarius]ASJ00981.1 hypothetical protein A3K92_05555 [Thermococcus gorgonarius]
MRKLKLSQGKERSFYILLVILLLSLSIRLYIAPHSTGSDITQFYGFAGTMLHHPLDFYSYADGEHWQEEGWPYNWPYVYGPVLAYLLALLRIIVGEGAVKFFWDASGYHVFASRSWIMAVKSLFILADAGTGILLYILLRKKSEKLALVVSSLYLFNPMVIYVSSVYGMFDGLALLPFLLGLYFVEKGRKNLGYGLIGFGLAVKHTLIFPALIVLWDELLDSWKNPEALKKSLRSFVAGIVIPFLPFLLKPSSLLEIPDLLQGMKPDYTYPIAYNLNGIVSLLTFIHEIGNLDTLFYMKHWVIFSVLALTVVLFIHYRLRNLRVSIALAYAAFLLTYWRVNTQYTLPLIAFLLLALPELDWPSRVVMFLPIIPPTIWPIAFPTSFWFHVHIEHPNWDMVKMVDRLTFMIFETGPFVVISVLFTLSLFALMVWMLAISFELRRCNG